jgi:hypothetical protein
MSHGDLYVVIRPIEVRIGSICSFTLLISVRILTVPSFLGDLYGGAHYSPSSSADLTPQGKSIVAAAMQFGNGETLPFTPCKKGYVPVVDGRRLFACPLHNKAREKRVGKENGIFRPGEINLNLLWTKMLRSATSTTGEKGARTTSTKLE